MTTHTPGHILAAWMQFRGFGVWTNATGQPASAYRISYEGMGDDHDLAISCYTVGSKREDKRGHRTGVISEFPTVQVRVRALRDPQVAVKLKELVDALDALNWATVSIAPKTYCLQNYSRQTGPAFLMEEDRNKRRVWTFSGNLTVQETG